MCEPHRWVIALAAVIAVVALGPAGDPPSVGLVRARVRSVTSVVEGRVESAVLDVVHVYSGPAEWEGREFNDVYRAESLNGQDAPYAFLVKEEGLWVLVSTAKGELVPTGDRRFLFPRRSQKRHPHYAEDLKMAEAVESVAKAKPEERVKGLIKLLTDTTPVVGLWAARTLGTSDDPAAGKYLDGYASKPDAKLPLLAQIGLDEALCNKNREEWMWSKPRVELLRGWVTAKADEFHAMRVLSRIDTADQNEEIRNDRAVELVRTAAENKDWPWKARRHAIFLVGMFSGRVVDDTAAFDWLFERVRTDDDIEVRRAAAYSVRDFLPLPPKRFSAVEDYLVFEKDKEVAETLRAAVKKQQEKDDGPKK